MIAIPNMKMPKSCVECHWYYELYDEHCTLGEFLLREYPTDVSEEPYILDVQRHPDCPLIGIVTCGECKYYEESEYIEGDMVCKYHIGQTYYTEADRFCSYGERK